MFGQSSGLVSIFDRTRLLSGGQEIEPTFSWMASDDGSPVTSVEARYFGGNSIGIISSHGTRIEMKGRNLTKDDNGSDSEEEGEQDNGNLPPPERCIKLWKLET